MKRILFSLGLLAVAASPAAAQLGNTGSSGWFVNIYDVANGTYSGNQSVYTPVANHPGEWEGNTGGTQWISAWDDFTTVPGAGDYNNTNDANARYHYTFSYYFDEPVGAGSLVFTAGWDNIFKGITFDGGSTMLPGDALFGPAPERDVNGHFGFCRNGDAMHNTGDAVCTATFKATTTPGAKYVAFEIWGDGLTDGMWLEWDQASVPTETVPEPATMTLLATGLVGLAGKSLRRRRSVSNS